MSRKQFRTYSLKGNSAGSQHLGEPAFLAVGKLRRPHGLKGEIVMSVWTDFPERLTPGVEVFIGNKYHPFRIRSVREFKTDLLLSFESVETREAVGMFRNQEVYIKTDTLPPLEEGEYYLHQLLGLKVINIEDSTQLGILSEVIETGANHVFVVKREFGKDLLLPDIDSVILDIDFNQGEMKVRLLPGLLGDDE